MDPFIMFDYFYVRMPALYPDHLHANMETMTYIKSGYLMHENEQWHHERMAPGDIHWLTSNEETQGCEFFGDHIDDKC